MIGYLREFFCPEPIFYSYPLPKDAVVAAIEKGFEGQINLFGTKDIRGKFLDKETFFIEIISSSYARGISFTPTFEGKIIQLENGVTQIQTRAKPNGTLYFWFIVIVIMALCYIYCYIRTEDESYILWSLGMLTILPALLIGISNSAIRAIRERYMIYIHKELSKMTR